MSENNLNNNSFTILHLSDLHIVPHGDAQILSTVLQRMIDHIAETTKDDNNIIIVFTGDLVEKARFAEAEEAILKFFSDLKEKLGDRVIDFVCSPGNHDKVRGNLTLKNEFDENNEAFWSDFKKNDWIYFENQFEEYKNIIDKIQTSVFKVNTQKNSTYGIRLVNTGSSNICFICLNSSWSSTGNGDEGKLRLGRFQLDELTAEYQKIKKKADLSIAMMHHPSDWLTKNEQKYLTRYMTDEYRLNTNIMLQGHIHEKETYNWYNQNHSITTLVTGMGWDQQQKINDNGHRYSLYQINMDSGIVKVKSYVTDRSGTFEEDTSLYNGRNIVFPLYVHKFLELNNWYFKNSEISLFYPKYNSADSLKDISDKLNDFCINMMKFLEEMRIDTVLFKQVNEYINKSLAEYMEVNILSREEFDYLIKDLENCDVLKNLDMIGEVFSNISRKTGQATKYLNKYLDEERDDYFIGENGIEINELYAFITRQSEIFLKDQFYAFIGEFCMQLSKKMFPEEAFENDSKVRVHFRRRCLNNDKIEYKKLFAHYKTMQNSKILCLSGDSTDLSDMNYYHSMIEKSFIEKRTLLSSLNPSYNTHKSKNDWIDFITISPNVECNIYRYTKDYENFEVPILSFGISVNTTRFQDIIRGMAYLGFDKILSRLLKEYYDISNYNIESLLSEVNQYE